MRKMSSGIVASNGGSGQTLSYAEKVQSDILPRTTKPVFIKEIDLFGTTKPPKSSWLYHVELYQNIADVIPVECLAGLQRVNGLWRIYLDNDDCRDLLVTKGVSVRGKSLPIYVTNPGHLMQEDTLLVRVKNIPLSADDLQIKRALTLRGCEVVSLYRERLRVNGRLTNCETGDRLITVKKLDSPLPYLIDIGKYRAVIRHRGQVNENITCNNCLAKGHVSKECKLEKICHECRKPGHVKSECPEIWGTSDDVNTYMQAEEGCADTEDSSDDTDGSSTDEEEDQVESTNIPVEEVVDSSNVLSTSNTPLVYSAQQRSHSGISTLEASDSQTNKQNNVEKVKKTKKSKKNKRANKESTGKIKSSGEVGSQGTQGVLDRYLVTPSRKSSSLGSDIRDPISPLDEQQNKLKKKK